MRGRWAGDGDDRRAPQLSHLADVSAAELEDLLRREDRLVMVEFWTPRCEPCRELRPQLEVLADEHCDVERGQELRRVKSGALPASTLRLLPGG